MFARKRLEYSPASVGGNGLKLEMALAGGPCEGKIRPTEKTETVLQRGHVDIASYSFMGIAHSEGKKRCVLL